MTLRMVNQVNEIITSHHHDKNIGLQSPSSPRECTQHANTMDNTTIMTIDDTHVGQTEHAKSGIAYEYEDFSEPCCLYFILNHWITAVDTYTVL